MDRRTVVTAFLRRRGEVLLRRRSEAVGSYPGQWGAVTGHAEEDPDDAVRREIREETGIDPGAATLVRRGEAFSLADDDLGIRWRVHPSLFDVPDRSIEPNWETDRHEWTAPTEMLQRETVPGLWTSYDRIRPSVETVRADTRHGSAYISLRALEVLRDEAALVRTGRRNGGWAEIAAIATGLIDARPSMTVVENRINRAMTAASETGRTPDAVATATREAIDRAVTADRDAARTAAARIDGRVATLSRSGTVLRTIAEANPTAVLLAESRPGGEGIAVGETLAPEVRVTVTSDAAFPHQILEWNADALLVGADAVLADGSVVNKVGTRGAALSASHEGIRVLVAVASDKISQAESFDTGSRPGSDLYDGDGELDVWNPVFDLTPPDAVDRVVTELGVHDPSEVRRISEAHGSRSEWSRPGEER